MAIDDSHDLTAGRSLACNSLVVHQASGVLMARHATTIQEAMASLYETAETTGVDVASVAASIVQSTRRP